jgi:hypothetical protein
VQDLNGIQAAVKHQCRHHGKRQQKQFLAQTAVGV